MWAFQADAARASATLLFQLLHSSSFIVSGEELAGSVKFLLPAAWRLVYGGSGEAGFPVLMIEDCLLTAEFRF